MPKNKYLIILILFTISIIPIGETVAIHSQIDQPISAIPQKLNSTRSQHIKEPIWQFGTNQVPVFTLDHRQITLSSGCDVNGDGFEDLLVGDGDYDYLYSQDDNGRAWLFFGSTDGLNTTPDVTFNPPYTNYYGFFGANTVCAGDVNGDGYDDIMISESNYDSSGSDEGAVFVYYGSPTGPSTTHNWMARGNITWGHFGRSIDGAGDVNNDGYDDIIVGTTETYLTTHVFVWFGGPEGLGDNGLPTNADWKASSSNPGAYGYGQVVRGIGDVNGDSYDDIMIGADVFDGSITNQGAVFVYFGSASGLGDPGTPANADWMGTGAQTDSRFGWAGDGVGDLNGDGYEDLAVGAYAYDNPETSEGKVFVWYGSSGGLGDNGTPANADWSAELDVSSYFGYVVRSAGDVNQDGFSDLIATAPSYGFDAQGEPLSGAGAWFIWTGSADGLGDNGTRANADYAGFGDQANGNLGRNEAGAADVNNDGWDDIFVAAYLYDDPETDEGVVFGYDLAPQGFTIFLPLILR
jgi:hypothetical protein